MRSFISSYLKYIKLTFSIEEKLAIELFKIGEKEG
jgi:hypothetical protein